MHMEPIWRLNKSYIVVIDPGMIGCDGLSSQGCAAYALLCDQQTNGEVLGLFMIGQCVASILSGLF